MAEKLKAYIVDLVDATRNHAGVLLGASPRASIALSNTARALALFDNQDFVTADHIQEIAVAIITHRLILDAQSEFSGASARSVVRDIVTAIPVPV